VLARQSAAALRALGWRVMALAVVVVVVGHHLLSWIAACCMP
jgi:hypothetical protein